MTKRKTNTATTTDKATAADAPPVAAAPADATPAAASTADDAKIERQTPDNAAPPPATEPVETPAAKPPSKTEILVALLRQPGGADIEAMMQATGWQAHSVRGALSGAVKKGLGLPVTSQKTEAGRVYSLPPSETAGGDQG